MARPPVESGHYPAVIIDADEHPSKKGGKYVKVIYEISRGEDRGRQLFGYYNSVHTNPKVVEIGERKLKKVGESAGYPEVTFEKCGGLRHKHVVIHVGYSKKDARYNDILDVFPPGGPQADPPASAPARQQRPMPDQQTDSPCTGPEGPWQDDDIPF